MSKTYIAKFDGKIVGKRTTKDRTYTHAVVVVASQEYYRKAAYDYVATETDKSNFRFYVQVAEGRSPYGQTNQEMIDASVRIDGGFDAYISRVRDREIQRFEQDILDGRFLPKVATWSGSRILANKATRLYLKPWNILVEVVEAEEVVKTKIAPVKFTVVKRR